MRYPRELIEEIRMQNDIVEVISQYVPLKQKGSSYFGLCPFHHEKTPSFSVNSEKQFYYCFGCGASGNVYGFLMEMENCDFPEAVKKLAERANIPLPEPQMTGQALVMERLKTRLFDRTDSSMSKTLVSGRWTKSKGTGARGSIVGYVSGLFLSKHIHPSVDRRSQSARSTQSPETTEIR